MTKNKPVQAVHPIHAGEHADAIRNAPDGTVFTYLWRNKFLTLHAKTFDDFHAALAAAAALLARWKTLGVELADYGVDNDYAVFTTTSKEVAQAEGFIFDQTEPEPDWPLNGDFSWVFGRDNYPASPAALIDALAKEDAILHADHDVGGEPFDTKRLTALSGLTRLDARFTCFFKGKHNIKRIGDGTYELTFAEILWLLHGATLKDHLGDHIFFESLRPVASDGTVQLFDVDMGS